MGCKTVNVMIEMLPAEGLNVSESECFGKNAFLGFGIFGKFPLGIIRNVSGFHPYPALTPLPPRPTSHRLTVLSTV